MRRFTAFILFLAAFLAPVMLSAQTLSSSEVHLDPDTVEQKIDSTLSISLLTCSPGQENYELYGHTAIRVTSRRDSIDIVYNYGVFDFTAPNFTWRFVLGQCDYLLYGEPLVLFAQQYYLRGSWVMEQVLNLTPYEATYLKEFLSLESLPQNRVYRYNIFRNNCTTRARDAIERCITGAVVYPARPRRNTYRSMLHQFTKEHPWAQEGNDLLLGTEVDTLITERDEMFAPIYLMWYADSAIIDNGRGAFRNLVLRRQILLPENAERQQAAADALPDFPLTPRIWGWMLLAVGLCLAVYEVRKRWVCWPVDAVLMTLQGLAGVLLTFMALFSVHPGVTSNWQVWLLNPIPLFFVYTVVKADRRHQRHVYHAFAAALIALFIIFYFIIPQDFAQIILPLALLLLSRAVVHLLVYRK